MGNRNPRQNRDALRAALEASAKEAPLPPGWETAYEKNGQIYFIDHLTGKTTYKDPRVKSKKIKGKPPKYELNSYSKIQHLLAKLHHKDNVYDNQIEIIVSRENLFEDTHAYFINNDPSYLKRKLFVRFEGEEGLDYGGMSRELVLSLSQEFLKPERELFVRSYDGYCYHINRNSHKNPKHLDLFSYFGMVLGLAAYHNKLVAQRFILPFYKQLLGRKLEFSDLKYYNEDMYNSLCKIKESSNVNNWDIHFELTDKDENGKIETTELMPGGSDIELTNENKEEFINLVLLHYFENGTKQQLEAIRKSFLAFIPIEFLQDFEPQELEQMTSGIQQIEINDLRQNTEYGEGLSESSPVIKFFWEILQTFSEEELQKFLQFTTGSNRVPVGGFGHLYGSYGPQKFQISLKKGNGLPTAHSCFNRLEILPYYSDKEKLKKELLLAITETAGFGLE